MHRLEPGPAWTGTGFIFTKPDGRPMDAEQVSKASAQIATTAGSKGVQFHDLRHTHASLMLSLGVHRKTVSEGLGQASVSIAMDTHSHVLPGLQEDAAQRFSTLLADRRSEQ